MDKKELFALAKQKSRIPDEVFNKLTADEKKQLAQMRKELKGGHPHGGNAVSWYYVTERMGKDVANVPFNIFGGVDLSKDVPNAAVYNSVPAVGVIRYFAYSGTSRSATSALNVASRALYSWVRHQNSGRTNYEAPDLTIAVLAISEVFRMIFEAKRIYKTAMTYTFENRAIPDLLLSAMGADPADVRANLAQFRYGINLRIAKLSSLFIPDVFDLFRRQALMASLVLLDSTSKRAQYYTFKSQNYLVFNATGNPNGGGLEVRETGSDRSVELILQQIDSMLDVLLQDEDTNIMCGDMLKAYGREKGLSVPELSESETIELVYDENILAQIENATFIQGNITFGNDPTANPGSFAVYQENGSLYSLPQMNSNGSNLYRLTDKNILNSHKDDPDWQDVLEWTRLMPTVDANTLIIEAGTEIPMEFTTYRYLYSSTGASIITNTTQCAVFMDGSVPSAEAIVMARMSTFDWHPICYVYDSATDAAAFQSFYGELKNYTFLDVATINRLHDCAVMGELKTQLIQG